VYNVLQRFVDRSPSTDNSARIARAVVLLLLGLSVGIGAAAADIYLHRGIESGAEQPYVVQPTGRELAINVDLTRYDADQLDQVATALGNNGYRYVRQSFAWSDIQPDRGTFNWDTYDRIVSVLGAKGIQVIAVLDRSPAWARAPEQASFSDAPPVAEADYATFVGEVAKRYKDQVQYFQLWDLPNRADHWGGQQTQAGAYVKILAPAFNAIRTANSEAKVILAELDPAFSNGGIGADLSFLRGIYDAGGAPFFDVVAAEIDGGTYSPYDRQVGLQRLNLSRAILFRELLIEKDDRGKPIWLTHFGWSTSNPQEVNAEQQADFMLAGIKRARAEWPWVGLIFSWSFLPNPNIPGDESRSMLSASGTASPAFQRLADYASGGAGTVASTGFVPMESAPVSYAGSWDNQHLNGVTFRTTAETGASATLQFRGTGVIAFLRLSPQAGPVTATLDGKPIPGWPVKNGASLIDLESFQAQDIPISLAKGLPDTAHTLTLTLADRGQLTIGGLVVSRDPPLLWPVIILIAIAVVFVAAGLRDVVYVIAIHSNALQRRSGVELRPPLPQMPDWRPARRF
jgi:hypothetical protein